jgi:hypothetical protein
MQHSCYPRKLLKAISYHLITYTPWGRDPIRTVFGLMAVVLVLAMGCATTQRQEVE